MDYTSFIGISVSLILTVIGPFYAYRCWRLWRHTNTTSIGAVVTQDRVFLSNNFKLVLIVGALSGLNVLFEVAQYFDPLAKPFIPNVFYYLNLAAIMTVILILAVSWYNLLSRVKRWDSRWITK